MTVSIHDLQRQQRTFTSWHQRGRIRKVDDQGLVQPGQFAAHGEVVQISPRYQRGGTNFRVRPERPAAFLAAWCFEHGLLPELLTAEECQDEAILHLLDQLWARCRSSFPQLGSPLAASDDSVEPGPRTGWSWNILQVLIEPTESIRTVARTRTFRPVVNGASAGPDLADTARRTIEALRARTRANGHAPSPPVPVQEPPAEDHLDMLALHEELAQLRGEAIGTPPPEASPLVDTTQEDPASNGHPVQQPADGGRKNKRRA